MLAISLRPEYVNSLWHHMASWVNIGSGNGLLPDGTKPLPGPMLISHPHQWDMWYQTRPSSFRQWLVACSSPSHYLNQWWLLINHTPSNRLQKTNDCYLLLLFLTILHHYLCSILHVVWFYGVFIFMLFMSDNSSCSCYLLTASDVK